jgi:hypothetical protein
MCWFHQFWVWIFKGDIFCFFIHWVFVFIWKCNLWECTHHLELYLVVCQGYIVFTNHIYDDDDDDDD